MNDKIIFKYKVIIFVIWCWGFHQVVGMGGKDLLFNFCLLLHGDLSFTHSLLSVTNTRSWICVSVWNWEGTSCRPAYMDRGQSLVRLYVVKLDIATGDCRQKTFRMNVSYCRSGKNNTLHGCLYPCMYTNYTIPVRTTVFLKMNPGVRNI
jgi:hypothetical protein